MNSLRIGFAMTTIIGLLYTAVGLFDSMLQLGIGIALTAAGVCGYGAVDYVEHRQIARWQDGRDTVWKRRERHLRLVKR